MKALTLWRPWTELVLRAGKDIENRPWPTRYRGPLAIHGGKRHDPNADEVATSILGVDHGVDLSVAAPTGLLGMVELVGVHVYDDCDGRCSPWAALDQFHWQLADPVPLPAPVPCNGAQGLWDVPPDLIPPAWVTS